LKYESGEVDTFVRLKTQNVLQLSGFKNKNAQRRNDGREFLRNLFELPTLSSSNVAAMVGMQKEYMSAVKVMPKISDW